MSELPRPIDPETARGLCHGHVPGRLCLRRVCYAWLPFVAAKRALVVCRALLLHLAGLK